MKFTISFVEYFSSSYMCYLMSWRIRKSGIIRSDRAGEPIKITTINMKDKIRIGGRYTNKRIKL